MLRSGGRRPNWAPARRRAWSQTGPPAAYSGSARLSQEADGEMPRSGRGVAGRERWSRGRWGRRRKGVQRALPTAGARLHPSIVPHVGPKLSWVAKESRPANGGESARRASRVRASAFTVALSLSQYSNARTGVVKRRPVTLRREGGCWIARHVLYAIVTQIRPGLSSTRAETHRGTPPSVHWSVCAAGSLWQRQKVGLTQKSRYWGREGQARRRLRAGGHAGQGRRPRRHVPLAH
jgi:hypothetical protein